MLQTTKVKTLSTKIEYEQIPNEKIRRSVVVNSAVYKSGEGGEFSTIPSFGAPLHFDWTKLAYAQLGYWAYNIRP